VCLVQHTRIIANPAQPRNPPKTAGAGKSSVIAALLRLTPITAGRISVLGDDAALLPLPALRRRFAVVPQAPLLFSGSLRDNLDPLGAYAEDDEELVMVLEVRVLALGLCAVLNWAGLGRAGPG
jgi:ABC-type transport system involved in cytochrome bd biosynthesis fused ATPase/permease subunit